MPQEDAIRQAVGKLLQATRRFTVAYEAWAHAPTPWQAIRRAQLEEAEQELEVAQHEVARREVALHLHDD
ncbi:MAG TPA: hypothetical protein VM370_00780 [Candidatus Thermoplasmatota archaeon]|nr:hypothetical protein [Candidatus Thermoplasmatota archaeon]